MVARHLTSDVAAILEQPGADVTLELTSAEQLGDGAGCLSPPDLELKEQIACRGVTLGEEEIVLILRVDVRDAGFVPKDLD